MSFFKERRVLKDMAPSVRLDEVHTQNCRVLPTRMHLLSCLPRGGLIAGQDFTSGNPVRAVPYSVIEACNEFCVQEGWEYTFLTLEPSGHFSFALAKSAT